MFVAEDETRVPRRPVGMALKLNMYTSSTKEGVRRVVEVCNWEVNEREKAEIDNECWEGGRVCDSGDGEPMFKAADEAVAEQCD